MELDLGSFDSVKKFAKDLKTVSKKPLDRLVCNAAVYQPALMTVRFVLKS
jgi:NAD(P)-dependent dehydrogenase (short-subunit alcohol dehydrogenase family)